MKAITTAILFLLIFFAVSCTKSSGSAVAQSPMDTTVVTPPKDTSTTPPSDTTKTPPQDTTSTAGYTSVLVGILNGLAITTNAAIDTTIAEFSTPGVVDISMQSYGGELLLTAELHAKQPMIVTTSGTSQQIGTWSDVLATTDAKAVQWSDTTNHPYVKIINPTAKEYLFSVFVKSASPATGVVTLRLPDGVAATNETYNEILSKHRFYALRYFHN